MPFSDEDPASGAKKVAPLMAEQQSRFLKVVTMDRKDSGFKHIPNLSNDSFTAPDPLRLFRFS